VSKKTLSPIKDLLDMCIITMLTATWLQAKWLLQQLWWWKNDRGWVVGTDCSLCYNTHAPWGCVILPCETHLYKWPWKLTYTSESIIEMLYIGNRLNDGNLGKLLPIQVRQMY
jgi:hypothetical protein